MARPKKHPDGLKKSVAFRLTEADFAEYQAKFNASGLTQSEFFRRYVLSNATTVVASPSPRASRDYGRLLFLANKTSNNINQLAHRANTDHLAGTVSAETYAALLENLQHISRHLKAMFDAG